MQQVTFSHERSPNYLYFKINTTSGSTISNDYKDINNIDSELELPGPPVVANFTKSARNFVVPEDGYIIHLVVVYDDTMISQYGSDAAALTRYVVKICIDPNQHCQGRPGRMERALLCDSRDTAF